MTQLTEKSTPEEVEGLLEKEERREEEQEELQEGEERAQGEEHEEEEKEEDSRFHQPTPSPFKRILLILFIAFFFWLAFVLGRARMLRNKKPQVVYAKRYSDEYTFRPAASPIITETMKDGRLKVRGAGPTSSAIPTPTPTPKKVKKRKTGKKLSKKLKKAKKSSGATR